jgi:ring-1,2-phenylacetyl-CoA epoxidase subunit PaaD
MVTVLADVAAEVAAERVARAWRVLDGVLDPEVPAVSIVELGIVRDVVARDEGLDVVLTPTYSGCPATEAIESAAVAALGDAGLGPTRCVMRRAPAWTTDWISATGRAKLAAYGIAPPGPQSDAVHPLRFFARPVACPRCGSRHTERLSVFGSTACKSLHRCLACREPFEHFKAI